MWSIVNIETLNICNLRCTHCPYSSMTREKQIMSMNLFRKVVDDSKEIGIKIANLNIYGEPLLDRLLFDRIDYCKSKGMQVQFTSNGTLLDKTMARRLVEHRVDRIYFSFDGSTRESYERIRVGANFREVKDNIERLSSLDSKPEIVIVTVLQDSNLPEKKEIRRMWKGIVDKIQCWPMDSRRDLWGISSRGRWPCYRVFREVNVLSSGEVALCCLDYDGGNIIGDTKNNTLREVWNSDYCKSARSLHLRFERYKMKLCKGCELPQREKLSLLRHLCCI